MNMIGMLLKQEIPLAALNRNPIETQSDHEGQSSFFQQLLSTEQSTDELFLNDNLQDSDLIDLEGLFNKLSDMSFDMLKELYVLLVGHTELVDEINGGEVVEELVSYIQNLIDNQDELAIPQWTQLKAEFQMRQQANNVQQATYFVSPALESQSQFIQPDQEVVQKQLDNIFVQVEALLSNVTDEQDLIRVSPRILELLEKWTILTEKFGGEIGQNTILPTTHLTESTAETKVKNVWQELVHTYQKRNELVSNQQYQASAKVTTKDISKWLQNNLKAQVNVEENVRTQPLHLSNQPLSKVEQYVIFMNQHGTTESVDKQLIDQFQQVMRTSRFLSMNNGVNQLSIALRPDNLGEMMVRFTEVNGEMTLKIMVSSQATRQMLESNIHQLKNMFSPHQVVIEEREATIDNVQGQPEEQAFSEEEEHPHESNQEESRNFDEEFETQFHQILMNEKV